MYFSTIVISAALSALSMPVIIRFAKKKSLYDTTSERKIHSGLIPRLGGVGMFWAFSLALGVFVVAGNRNIDMGLMRRWIRLAPLAFGAIAIHILGFIDDIRSLPARRKFILQSCIGLFVVGAGFRFHGLGYAPTVFSGPFDWLFIFISWGWIVGMTNAINLIDGMDGLAGGIVAIVSAAFSGFYLLNGDISSSVICFALTGVVLGFLCVNFPAPKAKLFMGDSGSLFLGFMLAVMPFLGQTNLSSNAAVPVGYSAGLLPAVALFAIPIFDTLRAIFRRLRAGVSISMGDRKHIHHLLLEYGYCPRQILRLIYVIVMIQALIFLLARSLPNLLSYGLTFLSLGMTIVFFVYVIGCSKNNTLSNNKI